MEFIHNTKYFFEFLKVLVFSKNPHFSNMSNISLHSQRLSWSLCIHAASAAGFPSLVDAPPTSLWLPGYPATFGECHKGGF